MNDLDLGWNEIGSDVQNLGSTPFTAAATPQLHPRLIATGVSKMDIKYQKRRSYHLLGQWRNHPPLHLQHQKHAQHHRPQSEVRRNVGMGRGQQGPITTRTIGTSLTWATAARSPTSGLTIARSPKPMTASWTSRTAATTSRSPGANTPATTARPIRTALSGSRSIRSNPTRRPTRCTISFAPPADSARQTSSRSSRDTIRLIWLAPTMGSAHHNALINARHSLTFHHQWFHNCWDRCVPRLRGGNVHDFNIYVDDTDGAGRKASARSCTL